MEKGYGQGLKEGFILGLSILIIVLVIELIYINF
jgi:hypothetical protein